MTPQQKFLEDVPPEKAFRFEDGSSARNIYELLDKIQNQDQGQFNRFSNNDKDDYVNWIQDVIEDRKLVSMLKKAHDKCSYERQIELRIRGLERKALIGTGGIKYLLSLGEEFQRKIFLSIMALVVLLVISAVFVSIYAQIDQRFQSFDDKVQNLEDRDVLLYTLQIQNLARFQNLTRATNLESPQNPEEFFHQGENVAPGDKVSERQIYVYEDKIIISVKNASWGKFLDTGSMLPTLGKNANSLEIEPGSTRDINVGDIIIYESPGMDGPIIHRVVEIGEDEQGWYAVTKGDNNNLADPSKVRFEQVKRLVIGVIY